VQTDCLPQPLKVIDGDVLLAVNDLTLEAAEQVDIIESAGRVM